MEGNLSDRFEQYVKEQELFRKTDRVLLAVSGGLDSVVMTHLFRHGKFGFGIGHCNYQLRGEASDTDATFVRKLAKDISAPYYATAFDTEKYAEDRKGSIQMIARQLRYEWLEMIREEHGYDYIAMAHHANDVVETMLLNFTRGGGLAGLHGILPKRGKVIRPLLFAPREEIFEFAIEHEFKWREDASNASLKYQRNLIRHKVLPTLKEINPSLEKTLVRSAGFFLQTEEYLQKKMAEEYHKIRTSDGVILKFDIAQLLRLKPLDYYLFSMFADYGFNHEQLEQLKAALNGPPGTRFYSEDHVLEIDRDHLNLYPAVLEDRQEEYLEINMDDRHVTFEHSEYNLSMVDLPGTTDYGDTDIAYLDADKVVFPFRIRHWRHGDRFVALGMEHPKKLSDFFVDEKFSLPEKYQTHIFESGGNIMWLAGIRLDNRFRITGQTRNVLRIERKRCK